MSEENLILELNGGRSVVDWFGRVPSFHDAEILGINLIQGRISSLSLHAWNITGAVDAKGFLVTDKHAVITIEFTTVHQIELSDFDFYHIGVISSLIVSGTAELTKVAWTSSVGVAGIIEGTGVTFSLCPHLAPNN